MVSLVSIPEFPNSRKCDCRKRGPWFDSRVGKNITGLFTVYRKFLSSSTVSGNMPSIWQQAYPLLYRTDTTNGEKYYVPSCALLSTPSGIKGIINYYFLINEPNK
ncbi:hypothetical protein SFRURICE_021107 [Spodoptera frugiperda]|nr:hypothetical protein SFRURICE_021107 [Spodoptera frugiperda]